MEQIRMVSVKHHKKTADTSPFSVSHAKQIRLFHSTFDEYEPTPLTALPALAEHMGIRELWVKDESLRFGLNSFKALGSSYAMSDLAGKGAFTAVTATDGNHGRGVAWTAARLGGKAYVYMPRGTAEERLKNIRALGAHGEILDMPYDDTVRYARSMAEKNGWLLFQDTCMEGYEDIPLRIMQGYITMGAEIMEQLGENIPTHVFLQAGVGSMAGAMAAFFAELYGSRRPRIIITEPNGADCFFRTAQADDGKLHFYPGETSSMMAGLCCGEPNPLAWDIIKDCGDHIIACDDHIAANGMRILGNPLAGDRAIISGESGAVNVGLLFSLLTENKWKDIREQLELDSSSAVLCINTEGDTDKKNYRDTVWLCGSLDV